MEKLIIPRTKIIQIINKINEVFNRMWDFMDCNTKDSETFNPDVIEIEYVKEGDNNYHINIETIDDLLDLIDIDKIDDFTYVSCMVFLEVLDELLKLEYRIKNCVGQVKIKNTNKSLINLLDNLVKYVSDSQYRKEIDIKKISDMLYKAHHHQHVEIFNEYDKKSKYS